MREQIYIYIETEVVLGDKQHSTFVIIIFNWLTMLTKGTLVHNRILTIVPPQTDKFCVFMLLLFLFFLDMVNFPFPTPFLFNLSKFLQLYSFFYGLVHAFSSFCQEHF